MHETPINACECRSLTVPATPSRPRRPVRRDAAFLAHLIATRAQAPQTRARRQVEPAEAMAAYLRASRLRA
jgi:hypothetical protein